MKQDRTLGRQLGIGFTTVITLVVALGFVSILTSRRVVAAKDAVIAEDMPRALDVQRMRAAAERKGSMARAYLLTGEQPFIEAGQEARRELISLADRIRPGLPTEGRGLLETVLRIEKEHETQTEVVQAMRAANEPNAAIVTAFDQRVVPRREALDSALRDLSAFQARDLEAARVAASEIASTATLVLLLIAGLGISLAIVLAVLLARRITQQIGTAVGQVQSSSAELQAAANQQATSAKEQATAMAEITTTITELLVTSRQIAESAQRVASIATQTASSARTGDATVDTASQSIGAIRQQVDLVVTHMLALGKKSQEIGSVLDLVSELAEQTNILAINATIEAAGAGDAGKRFGVVADEIRKLADRVTISSKEIRTLIDDVRAAVNTTVMATETGSKAVDTGKKQFTDVTSAFKHIANLVGTATEAAREIELSTKQQTSAVEQVNIAIANVAQTTRESEASSSQTLQTAVQLNNLSRDLRGLVEADRSA
jgi:methyl-accepting chemotaxis protein